MNTQEKLALLKSKKLTAEQNIKQFLEKIKSWDKKINAFIQVNPNALQEAREIDKKIKSGKAGKLAGLAIAVKSNINVQGLLATCASKTLENYNATYNASVIEKIKAEDGIIIGMTNMDEFACGSSGETSVFGPTKNPAANVVPGGSSSGSAASVSAEFCDLALGSDTGGSIRNPASNCNVIGLKPTYGLVSRYGLIDLAMSLDQIGTFSNDVFGSALLLGIIAGKDEKDPTTFDEKIPSYEKELETLGNYQISGAPKTRKFSSETRKLKIALSPDFEKICDKEIYDHIKKKTVGLCEKNGWKLEKIGLKHIELAVQSYYPLVYVEFFSGTRKFDGRKYGKRIEEVCGPEVLRRILGGSEISKAEYHGLYYRNALRAAQLIKQEFETAFKEVDAIICPTVPKLPHKIGAKISTEEMYSYDAMTIPANLAGIPAISIPAGKIKQIPVGLQVMVPLFHESRMFQIARAFEKLK